MFLHLYTYIPFLNAETGCIILKVDPSHPRSGHSRYNLQEHHRDGPRSDSNTRANRGGHAVTSSFHVLLLWTSPLCTYACDVRNRSAPAGSQTVVDDRVASPILKVLLGECDQYVCNPSCCGRTCKHRGVSLCCPAFCSGHYNSLLAALCAVVLPFHLEVESKQQQPEENTLLDQQLHAQ